MTPSERLTSRVFAVGCLWWLMIAAAIGLQLSILEFYPEWPRWRVAQGHGPSPGVGYGGIGAGIGQLILELFAVLIGLVSAIVFVATGIAASRSPVGRIAIGSVALITAINVIVLFSLRPVKGNLDSWILRQSPVERPAELAPIERGPEVAQINRAKEEERARAEKLADDEFRRGRWTHSEGDYLELLWDPARGCLWSRSSTASMIYLQRWDNDQESPVETVTIDGSRGKLGDCIRDGDYFLQNEINGRAVIQIRSLANPRIADVIPDGDLMYVSRDGRRIAAFRLGAEVRVGLHAGRKPFNVRVWNRLAKSIVWESPQLFTIFTPNTALSDDGSLVAANPEILPWRPGDGQPAPKNPLRVWNTVTGSEQVAVVAPGRPLSFSPAGDLLAVEVSNLATGERNLKVVRTKDWAISASFKVAFDSPRALRWGIDGNPYWITAGYAPEIIVCNLNTGQVERSRLPYGQPSNLTTPFITPDRQTLYVVERGAILRFNLATGQEISGR